MLPFSGIVVIFPGMAVPLPPVRFDGRWARNSRFQPRAERDVSFSLFWKYFHYLFNILFVCFVFLDRTTFKDIRQCILRIQNSISSFLTIMLQLMGNSYCLQTCDITFSLNMSARRNAHIRSLQADEPTTPQMLR